MLGDYVTNTLVLALGVAGGTAIGGVAAAWLVTMCRFPGSRVLEWALILPLAVPAYVLAYAYTDLLQVSGPVQTMLRDATGWGVRDYWFPEIRSLGGAVMVMTFTLYPYVVMAASVFAIFYAGVTGASAAWFWIPGQLVAIEVAVFVGNGTRRWTRALAPPC